MKTLCSDSISIKGDSLEVRKVEAQKAEPSVVRVSSQPKTLCGNNISFGVGQWNFNNVEVVRNFPEHLKMSIPLYEETHKTLIASILKYASSTSNSTIRVLDIGCSLGSFDASLAKYSGTAVANFKGIEITAVDTSSLMISKCEALHKEFQDDITFVCGDPINLLDTKSIGTFDVVVSLYTFQFMSDDYRADLLKLIHKRLKSLGLFVVADKFKGVCPAQEELNADLYKNFKLAQGFTAEECEAKTRALKGVQNPMSVEMFKSMVLSAGFMDNVELVNKLWSFESYLFTRGIL